METQKKKTVQVNKKDYNKESHGEEKEYFEKLSIHTLEVNDGKPKIKLDEEELEHKIKTKQDNKAEENNKNEDYNKPEENNNPKESNISENYNKSEQDTQIEKNKRTEIKSDNENNKNSEEAKIVQEEKQTSEKICRICYDDQSEEKLLSPCKCSGSVGWVHNSCLQKWISISHKKECSACKYQYQYTKKYKREFYRHLDKAYIPKLLTILFILITTILSGLISKLLMKLLKFKSNINIGFNIKYFLFSLKYFSIIFFFSLPVLHYFKIINIRETYNNYISLYERNNTAYGQGLTDISVFIYLTIYKFIEEKINKMTESEKIIANYVPGS